MLRHACGYKLANEGHERGRSKLISDIAIFRTLRAIRLWLLAVQRIFPRLKYSYEHNQADRGLRVCGQFCVLM